MTRRETKTQSQHVTEQEVRRQTYRLIICEEKRCSALLLKSSVTSVLPTCSTLCVCVFACVCVCVRACVPFWQLHPGHHRPGFSADWQRSELWHHPLSSLHKPNKIQHLKELIKQNEPSVISVQLCLYKQRLLQGRVALRVLNQHHQRTHF